MELGKSHPRSGTVLCKVWIPAATAIISQRGAAPHQGWRDGPSRGEEIAADIWRIAGWDDANKCIQGGFIPQAFSRTLCASMAPKPLL